MSHPYLQTEARFGIDRVFRPCISQIFVGAACLECLVRVSLRMVIDRTRLNHRKYSFTLCVALRGFSDRTWLIDAKYLLLLLSAVIVWHTAASFSSQSGGVCWRSGPACRLFVYGRYSVNWIPLDRQRCHTKQITYRMVTVDAPRCSCPDAG
jgi:hypothetical protein